MDGQVEVASLAPAVEAGDPEPPAVAAHAAQPVVRPSRSAGDRAAVVQSPVHANHEPGGLVAIEQAEVDFSVEAPRHCLAPVIGETSDS